MKGKKFLQSIAITATVAGSICGMITVNSAEFMDTNDYISDANVNLESIYPLKDYQTSLSSNSDMSDNIYLSNKTKNLDMMAKEMFGTMRDSTEEERSSINKYIDSISKHTGVNFFDI